jgi:hypothetical protein
VDQAGVPEPAVQGPAADANPDLLIECFRRLPSGPRPNRPPHRRNRDEPSSIARASFGEIVFGRMGWFQPTPPPFDLDEWRSKPYLARLKPVCQDWAVNGFGTPYAI